MCLRAFRCPVVPVYMYSYRTSSVRMEKREALGGSYESVRLSKLVGAAVKIPYLSVMISFLFLHTYVCTDII